MSSAICFNLDESNILSSGKGLNLNLRNKCNETFNFVAIAMACFGINIIPLSDSVDQRSECTYTVLKSA